MFKDYDVLSIHIVDVTAIGEIARYCGLLAVAAHQCCALLPTGWSLRRAHVMPEARKNIYSHSSN
jgi:hypothetical protein